MITENLSTLKIHRLTNEQYNREFDAGRIDPNAVYFTTNKKNDIYVQDSAPENAKDGSLWVDLGASGSLGGILNDSSGASGDWSAAEGDPGHIRNRTHYVTGTTEKVLLDKIFTVSGNQWIGRGLFPFVVGEVYNAVWDNTEYECEAFAAVFEGMDVVCIGNPLLLGTTENNNMPFVFGSIASYGMSALGAMADGDHHLVITETTYAYKQLPEEAIPDISVPWVYKFNKGDFGDINTYPTSVEISDISFDKFADFLYRGGTLVLDMTDALPSNKYATLTQVKKVIDWFYVLDESTNEKFLILYTFAPVPWSYDGNDKPIPEYMQIAFTNGTWIPPLR